MTWDMKGWIKSLHTDLVLGQLGKPLDFAQGGTSAQRAKVLERQSNKVNIELPRHFYPPEDADTVDIATVATLPVGSSLIEMLRLRPKRGELAIITHYSMSNDALLATDADFYPLVNDKRILPYHGDPLDDFRLYLSISPDLSVLKSGVVIVGPDDLYQWKVTNNGAVAITVGVRAVGYITRHQLVEAKRFG